MVPHLHYNLNRQFTLITIMDEYNEITKSPTLVAFGGSHTMDHTIYYLDLEPKLSDENSSLYEWKELTTVTKNINGEYFQLNRLDYYNASMIYSRKLQQLIIFEGSTNGIYSLCLKTKTWAKALELNFVGWPIYHAHFLKLCDEHSNHALLVSRFTDYSNFNLMIGMIDLDDLCATIHTPQKSVTFLKPPKVCKRNSVTPNYVVPLRHKQQLVIFDTNEKSVITTSLSNQDEKTQRCDCMTPNCNRLVACVLPTDGLSVVPSQEDEDLHGTQLLVSFIRDKQHCLYEYHSKKETFTRLIHNPLPIQLEHHIFFQPVLCTYRNRRKERCAIFMPNLDILFKIKLDYEKPECAFPYLRKQLLTLFGENFDIALHASMRKDLITIVCQNHYLH
ncbi:hypothetical protein C9374_000472 [Naegleria lovaniensis]|uniref:Uncharacterized protein n=1 Tax=Naegleria lovaniensis TaxID=51637 RepID=A0AA88GXR2_NAELO|nr:uncharacterized protein C9374_000472 [Naegleria lovaniensis]KAG2388308.1 hypothetical protein C9374_000472 [Naegleria lovaniensis]